MPFGPDPLAIDIPANSVIPSDQRIGPGRVPVPEGDKECLCLRACACDAGVATTQLESPRGTAVVKPKTAKHLAPLRDEPVLHWVVPYPLARRPASSRTATPAPPTRLGTTTTQTFA
ncbi:hypothetical protein VTN00DRAFT_6345 [Thermoascus crustaceus]|uniref:uncharacterized protein n=1 Tax=Thermoascus crustaceus TaxID=5088 RepID=UPI00374431A5